MSSQLAFASGLGLQLFFATICVYVVLYVCQFCILSGKAEQGGWVLMAMARVGEGFALVSYWDSPRASQSNPIHTTVVAHSTWRRSSQGLLQQSQTAIRFEYIYDTKSQANQPASAMPCKIV